MTTTNAETTTETRTTTMRKECCYSFLHWKRWHFGHVYGQEVENTAQQQQQQEVSPAFDFLREMLQTAADGNEENQIWNIVRAFGENFGEGNEESWAVLKEAYERIGRLSGETETSGENTELDAGRDAFLSRLMQSVASGSFGDGNLMESFAQAGGEDGFFSGRETFLTRMLQDVIQSGGAGEGAVLGDGTFANRLIDNLNAVEPRDALRSLIEAIQTTSSFSNSGDPNIVQSLSGIDTSSLPLSDEIRAEISRRLQRAAEKFNLTLSEPGSFTSEEVRLLGEKIIEDAILTSQSDSESTSVSFESNFAPPLREVFLSFFSASLRSSMNATTSTAEKNPLDVMVRTAIQDAMDSAVRFGSDILFLNAGRNSTSANTDEVMALYDRVIGIMSSSRSIFTQVLADAAEKNTGDDDDRESETLRRAQQLLEAFRASNIWNTDDQVREMGGDEFSNAGRVKDRIVYPPTSSNNTQQQQQTASKPSGVLNERAKKLLIAFSALFVAFFTAIGIFNRFCSSSAKMRRVNMILPEARDQHVDEQPSSRSETYRQANKEGVPVAEPTDEDRPLAPPPSPETSEREQNKETTTTFGKETTTSTYQFPVPRKSSLVRRTPSTGF
ncbi:unnamed protein product [Bathycoccus prasinos]